MIYKNKVRKLINNREIFSKIDSYVKLIETENQKINLTGFNIEQIWKEGIYESLICFEDIKFKGKFLDIGSGAGFPSIPLLIVNPEIKLTIIESMTKKINFLKNVKEKLCLDLNLINDRVEKITNENFDFITARAVAPIFKLIKISYHIGSKKAIFYWIKGRNVEKELFIAKNIVNKLKIKNIKIIKKVIDNKIINIIQYHKNN